MMFELRMIECGISQIRFVLLSTKVTNNMLNSLCTTWCWCF